MKTSSWRVPSSGGKGANLPHKQAKKKKSQSHIMTLSKASGMQDLRINIHSGIYIKRKNKQVPNCRHPLDLAIHIWNIYAVYLFPYNTNTYTHNTYTWILCYVSQLIDIPFLLSRCVLRYCITQVSYFSRNISPNPIS